MNEREEKLKLMNQEKQQAQKEASAIKLEFTKKKLAESASKRELSLKIQRDTIESKI